MATNKETKIEEAVQTVKTTENVVAETVVEDGREEIYVPKGYANDDPNLPLSINGKRYLLPKGKTSKVPPAVAALYRRTVRAQEKLDATVEALANKASK